MKRKDSILGTYNAQKLPRVKIGNGQFIGNSLLPNIDFLKQLQQKERQRPRFSINPYMFADNPQPGINIFGLGANANINLLNQGRNRLDLTGGANSVSVGYPGGVDLFGKPQFSGGLKFIHTFGNGGQNAFRKRNFERSLPDYRVDPILKFDPGGQKKTDSTASEKEKIKELEEIIITAPRRKKTVPPKKTVSLPAVNYKPFVPTVSADYFKQKTYAPNRNELTPYDLYELYDQEQNPVVQPSVQTPPPVYYPTQQDPITLKSLYNKPSEADAYMQILEQFDPERAQLMKMMKQDAFNNNYFFNGGFLMPARHGGWLDRYAPGGEYPGAGGKVPSQGNNQIPPQQPTAQTGAPSGPTFSNQYVPQEEEKRNRFYDFAMGALGVGAFLGSTGLFNKKKKFLNDQPKDSDQPDLNSEFPVRYNNDGNGKPQGGGSPAYSDGIVGSPEARGAGLYNTQGSFNSYQGNFAKLGGNVGIYGVRDYNQDVLSNFVHGGPLKRYNVGGANNPCPPGWKQNEKGECVQDEAARRALAKKNVEIARQHIKNKSFFPVPQSILDTEEGRKGAYGCIGGVCEILKESGALVNPKFNTWSNTDFERNAKEYGFPNAGIGLSGFDNLEDGDVLQLYHSYNDQGNVYPSHSMLFLGKNKDGKYEFFDNYDATTGGGDGLTIWDEDRVREELDLKNRKKDESHGRIFKVNPWTAPPAFASPEAQAAFENKQRQLASETGYDPQYNYSINPESYITKNKLQVPKGMQYVIDFGNNNEKVNSLLESLNRINLGNVAQKAEVHNSIQNVFGILGQENKWDNRWFGGDYGLENTFENIVAPFEKSVGPGQIKFSEISPEMKKEFGIESPRDLFNWEKLIPLMVARDLENKNWMKNQGENLGLRITGSPASYENLPQDYRYYSPYFWRGYGQQIKTQAGNAFDKNNSVSNFKSRDEYNAARNKFINDNLSTYQKKFDKESYGRNVQENIKNFLTWDIGNFDRELPEIVIQAPKKYYGGDISIPDLEQGNWLDKYEGGGPIGGEWVSLPKTQPTRSQPIEGREDLGLLSTDYLKSFLPEYKRLMGVPNAPNDMYDRMYGYLNKKGMDPYQSAHIVSFLNSNYDQFGNLNRYVPEPVVKRYSQEEIDRMEKKAAEKNKKVAGKFGEDYFKNGGQTNWLNRYDNGGELQKFFPGGSAGFNLTTTTTLPVTGNNTQPPAPTSPEVKIDPITGRQTWGNYTYFPEIYDNYSKEPQGWTKDLDDVIVTGYKKKSPTFLDGEFRYDGPTMDVEFDEQGNPRYVTRPGELRFERNQDKKENQMVWAENAPQEKPQYDKIPININYEDVARRGDIGTQTGTGTQVLLNQAIGSQNIANQKFERGVAALMSSGYSQEDAVRQYQNYVQNPSLFKNTEKIINDYDNLSYNITTHPDYDPNKPIDQQKSLAYDNSLRTSVLRGRNKLLQPTGNGFLDFATGIAAGPGIAASNLGFDAYNRYGKLIEQGNYLDAAGNFAMDLFGVAPMTTTNAVLTGANRFGQGANLMYNTGRNVFNYGKNKALNAVGISTRPPYAIPYMQTQRFTSPSVTQSTNAFSTIQQGAGPRVAPTLNLTTKGSTLPQGMVYTNKDIAYINNSVPAQYKPNLNLVTNDLGEKIGEGGYHNVGVYLNKNNADELIKIEKLGVQGHTMGWPGYKDVDLVALTGKVADNPYIGNVTRSVPLGDAYRALYLKRVPGKQYANLSTGSANKVFQPGNTLDLFNKIKQVTRNDMTFDFVGDNVVFNPKTGRSSIFDLSPNVPYNPLDLNDQSTFWMNDITRNIHLQRQPLTLAPTPIPKINFTPTKNWSLSVPANRLTSSQNIKKSLLDKMRGFEEGRLTELENRYIQNNQNWSNPAFRDRWYNFENAYRNRMNERLNLMDRTIDLSNFNIAYKKGGLVKKQNNKWLDNI